MAHLTYPRKACTLFASTIGAVLVMAAHPVRAQSIGAAPDDPSAMAEACEPLLAALQRARAQPVVSQYRVDAGMWPLSLEPVAFRVGDLTHETEDGRIVARPVTPGQDPLVTRLQADLAAGRAWCHADGADILHGVAVTRVRFRHPELDDQYQPATVLIEASSGLPLWHGYASLGGGFAWVYGPGPFVFPPPSALRTQP